MTAAQIQQLAQLEQLLKNMDKNVLEDKIERVRQLYPNQGQTMKQYFDQFYQSFEQEEPAELNELKFTDSFVPTFTFSQVKNLEQQVWPNLPLLNLNII